MPSWVARVLPFAPTATHPRGVLPDGGAQRHWGPLRTGFAALVVVAFAGCQAGVPTNSFVDDGSPPRAEPGDFECSSAPLEPQADAGVDAGAASMEEQPDPYETLESAVANFSGICRRACQCGLEQEEECLMRALGEELVAEATTEAGLDEDAQERCRAAVEAVDLCSLPLDCEDFEFFVSNLAQGFTQGSCFTFEGAAVQCPTEFPCLTQEVEFEAACIELWEAIDQLLSQSAQ